MLQSGTVEWNNGNGLAHEAPMSERRRLPLKEWHDVLRHMNAEAINCLEKSDLIEVSDSTFASQMRRSTRPEGKSEAKRCGRGVRSPKTLGEVVHTEIQGHFRTDSTACGVFCF